jgi:hypothetical protein
MFALTPGAFFELAVRKFGYYCYIILLRYECMRLRSGIRFVCYCISGDIVGSDGVGLYSLLLICNVA